jgi:hypothetical protein
LHRVWTKGLARKEAMSDRPKVKFRQEGDLHVLHCPDCSTKIKNKKKGVAVLDMLNHGRKQHKWIWTENIW